MTTAGEYHVPVLLNEALDFLRVQSDQCYIDATVGGGGHSAAILERGGMVLGIDRDPEAIAFVNRRFAAAIRRGQFRAVRGSFTTIAEIAVAGGFKPAAGILFDLGLSSRQIAGSGHGFSFLKNEPLDMRMDPTLAVKAADLLNGLTEKELNDLFNRLAEEHHSRAIARACVSARRVKPLTTTWELAGILAWLETGSREDFWAWYGCIFEKSPDRFGSFDRRARVFQALRIAVNNEIENLEQALPRALEQLAVRGRLVVISFHSLEDRVVKNFGRHASQATTTTVARGPERPRLQVLTRRPVTASAEELRKNPRARSAKLRAFERVR